MLVYSEGVLLCLTFTVSHVGVELETSFTQAQERAISVDTLAPDAHIVFTAFILIYGREKGKKRGRQDKLREINEEGWVESCYILIII